MSLQPEQLAWFLLEVVNRTQARGRTAQLVVPRDPEIVSELGRELNTAPTEEELVSAEEYLERHGYVALSDFQLSRATYTITTAGLDWLSEGLPWRPEVPQTAAGEPDRDTVSPEPQSGMSRPWWRRVFGG
jgi:hypothetical protein